MDLSLVLLEASRVREQYDGYCLHADSLPKRIEDYLHIISEYSGYKICRNTGDQVQKYWKFRQIKGCLIRYGGVAHIFVAPEKDVHPEGVTRCENRFITIKEASHLVIDKPDQYIQHCGDLVDEIIYSKPNLSDHSEPVQSEIMAQLFAMELLYPFEFREADLARIEDENNPTTYLNIADKYKVPQRMVRWVLRKGNHATLKSIHDIFDKISESYKVES